MAKGFLPPSADGFYHCRKCPDDQSKFKTIRELRQHQWAAHREAYEPTIRAAQRNNRAAKEKKLTRRHAWRKEAKERESATRKVGRPPSVRMQIEQSLDKFRNGDMRVSDVIEELQTQRQFLDDMLSMLTEIAQSKG